MSASLLPPNATRAETAFAEATGRIDLIGAPIRNLWNADNCPEPFLPWMAWMLSVDQWDRNWPVSIKRQVIRESLSVHRTKGTRASVERALAAMGFPDAQIVEGNSAERYNGTHLYDGSATYGQALHWAEYQVFIPRPISIEQGNLIRQALATVAPARCHLSALNFEQAQALYNGSITHDGTFSHGVT